MNSQVWFDGFSYLLYLESADGLICLVCVLFPMSPDRGSRAKILNIAISQLEEDKKKFEKSFSRRIRQSFYGQIEKFSVLSKTQQQIDQFIKQSSAMVVNQNRQYIYSMRSSIVGGKKSLREAIITMGIYMVKLIENEIVSKN